ncbi:MAG: sulfite dehydrogenase [Acidobacteriia bacterium]|nr:sulfite dehydrogenase [Terriglobia bacterium]
MKKGSNRRKFLFSASLGAAMTGCRQGEKPAAEDEGPNRLGKPVSEYGDRSPHEKSKRLKPETKTPEAASTRTPLQDSYGILTPAALHFERHHSGVPAIDPARHQLLLHGLVDRPLVFGMDELKRLPSVSRIHFVECSGNGRSEWSAKGAPDAQRSQGLASCSEWTGVPLSLLLAEAGVQSSAKWLLAEGGDASKMSRSIPLQKANEDILVAYGQNGEALRPEQGYPLRLVVPGWEGNINVKWLRRIKVVDEPVMTKDETSKYTDLMADGKARIFTFVVDAKSLITYPSGGQKLAAKGFHEISGLAWSGRGKIERVEVSTDGGKSWVNARLEEPRHRMAFTRFRLPWTWDGSETVLVSRCTDESGYVQPDRAQLIEARGMNSDYHNNATKPWQVMADGSVKNA